MSFDLRLIVWGWGFLEADFARFYHLDLYEEVFVEDISQRRFFALISGLGEDSAFIRFYRSKDYKLAQTLC